MFDVMTNRPYWERVNHLDFDLPAPYLCRARDCGTPGVWNIRHRNKWGGGAQSHYWCNDHLPTQYVTALYMLVRAMQAAWWARVEAQ